MITTKKEEELKIISAVEEDLIKVQAKADRITALWAELRKATRELAADVVSMPAASSTHLIAQANLANELKEFWNAALHAQEHLPEVDSALRSYLSLVRGILTDLRHRVEEGCKCEKCVAQAAPMKGAN